MWNYRQAINISSHTTTESNVYIITTVNIGSTIKAQTDGGDFRFVTQTGSPLSYYISAGVGTTNITFHIQFSSFPSGAQTIYVYYGNSTVVNGFSASDFSTQATNYTIGSLSTEEVGGSPIAYWKFDEGTGIVANDSVNNNNGVINKATWSNQGKFNKGLDFSPNQESIFLNYKVWKVGQTGSVTSFSRNGTASENFRVFDTDPFGRKVAVWEAAQNDIASNDDGGWESSNIAIDQTKMYRFSTWIRRTVLGNGTYFFGTYGKNSGGTNIGIMNRSVGTTTTNPYFRATSGNEILSTNSWFLLVGHVWPVNSGTGPVFSDTGLYNSAGTKIATPVDFVWQDGTYYTTHRTYLYYSTDSSTVQQWVYPRVDVVDGTEPSIQDLLNGHDSYGSDVYLNTSDPKESFSFWYDKNSTGDWQHIVKSSSDYYVNGKLSTPDEYPIYVSGNDIYIGRTTDSDFVTGSIDEFKIYPYARTAAQIKLDYNSRGSSKGSSANLGVKSNTEPTISSKLIAYYKFDEGTGLIANNSVNIGSSLNGTLSGAVIPSWTNNGVFNKALNFNGTNSNVFIGSTLPLTSQATYTGWFKIDSFNDWASVFGSFKYASNTNSIGFNFIPFSGFIRVCSGNGTGAYVTNNFNSTDIILNKWIYGALVYDSTNIKVYINGKYLGSAARPLSHTNTNFVIGRWATDYTSAYYFPGTIDEVKIYNSALTADEVKMDYNQGSAISFGTTNQTIGNTTTSLEYCIPGDTSYCASPVAEWNFEENTGTSTKDTSGNNFSANFSTGTSAPIWTVGKKNSGASIKFNGESTSSYLSTLYPSTGPTSYTAEAWIKPNSVSGTGDHSTYGYTIMAASVDGSRYPVWITIRNGEIKTYAFSTTQETVGANILANQWYHIAVSATQNSTATIYVYGIGKTSFTAGAGAWDITDKLVIGDLRPDRNISFNGSIDQVRIYNYARTPAQVAYDYNKGAPIGWWKLDECQGNIANDSSGIGNTGSINIGASGTQNSLGTCQIGTSAAWTAGASGHTNSSLNFDGNDDYMTAPLSVSGSEATVAFWVKNPATGLGTYLFRSNANVRTYITVSGNNIAFSKGNPSVGLGSYSVITSNWNHIALKWWTSSGTTYGQAYINGQAVGIGTSFTDNTQGSYITVAAFGSAGTANTSGQFDDVRVYNYALTSEQIKVLYNGGSVSFN